MRRKRLALSWQIAPTIRFTLLQDKYPVKSQRVTQALLKMIRLDSEGLRRVFDEV